MKYVRERRACVIIECVYDDNDIQVSCSVHTRINLVNTNNWQASEGSETLSVVFNRELGMFVCLYMCGRAYVIFVF